MNVVGSFEEGFKHPNLKAEVKTSKGKRRRAVQKRNKVKKEKQKGLSESVSLY
jgi:hypothetical protein